MRLACTCVPLFPPSIRVRSWIVSILNSCVPSYDCHTSFVVMMSERKKKFPGIRYVIFNGGMVIVLLLPGVLPPFFLLVGSVFHVQQFCWPVRTPHVFFGREICCWGTGAFFNIVLEASF